MTAANRAIRKSQARLPRIRLGERLLVLGNVGQRDGVAVDQPGLTSVPEPLVAGISIDLASGLTDQPLARYPFLTASGKCVLSGVFPGRVGLPVFN